MARPRVLNKKITMAFMIEPEMVQELDSYAEKLGVSRSHLINRCVKTSLDDLRILERMGVLLARKSVSYLLGLRRKNIVEKVSGIGAV